MRKKKAPLALVSILVVLVGAVVYANARFHTDPNAKPDEQQQPQQGASAPPISKEDMSKSLKGSLSASKGGPGMRTAPGKGGSMLLMGGRRGPGAGGPPAELKPDLSSQTQGQWYKDDSALKH